MQSHNMKSQNMQSQNMKSHHTELQNVKLQITETATKVFNAGNHSVKKYRLVIKVNTIFHFESFCLVLEM